MKTSKVESVSRFVWLLILAGLLFFTGYLFISTLKLVSNIYTIMIGFVIVREMYISFSSMK
jgi:hypothetical protein